MTTRLLILLAAALLCWAAPAQAQTIKSLGYNTTNGRIVAATNVVWTNAFNFSTNTVAAQVRTNLALGDTNNVTFKNITISDQTLTLSHGTEDDVIVRNESGNLELESPVTIIAFSPISFNNTTNAATTRDNLGLGGFRKTDGEVFAEIYSGEDLRIVAGDSIEFYEGFSFGGTNAAAFASGSRASLGLGLPALTNTSNVTTMRALAGSTNTNEPYSGTVALTNTNVLTFSNGVLLKIQ